MTEIRGHNVKVEGDGPAPRCQYPACHRRAEFMYRERGTDLRVYRPWCGNHRPGRLGAEDVKPLPHAYPRDSVVWPDDVRCPFCHRKREPRTSHILRPACRQHRGCGPDGQRPPGCPCIHPAPAKPRAPRVSPPLRTTPRHIRRATITPDGPVPAKLWAAFPYRDNGRAKTMAIPKADRVLLRALWKADEGHYMSATDDRLTRKYPTSLISALWNYWYEKAGT